MPFENGPYVAVSGFCENALVDNRGSLSIIRMVDRLTVENLVRNEDGTITEIEEATAVMMNWWYVLSIKPGEYEGEAQIKLILERPNNTEVVIQDWSVAFESGKGRGLVLQLALRLEMRGGWQLKVLLNGELFTRAPFEIIDRSSLPEQERVPRFGLPTMTDLEV